MNDESTNPEAIKRIEALADRLQKFELSPEYALATQTLMQTQKDNFEMLERSLAMIQAVHTAESKNNDFYIDLIKFLLPLFVTAAIAGASFEIQNINSFALMGIGIAGIVICFIILSPLLLNRHHRAKRQRGEYEKLAEAFKQWQSLAELQRKMSGEINSSDEARAMVAGFTDLVEDIDKIKA